MKMQQKRQEYYKKKRTGSHWAYPVHINSLQPQTYGDNSLLIDYSVLRPVDLSKYEDRIQILL